MRQIALCFCLGAIALGCSSGLRRSTPLWSPGEIGPQQFAIPIDEAARCLVAAGNESLPVREPPFILAVSPLDRPSDPADVRCIWRDGDLVTAQYLSRSSGQPLSFRERYFAPYVDLDTVEALYRVDPKFQVSAAGDSEVFPRSKTPTYHLAYLCSDGLNHAFAVGIVRSKLSGYGAILVVEHREGKYRTVSYRNTWEA